MFDRLVIIGAGGHGRVVGDIAQKCGYNNIRFADDNICGEYIGDVLVESCDKLSEYNDGKTEFIVAIGDNATRRCIATRYDFPWATLIHPSAKIGNNVVIGVGTVVMANAVINTCTTVGEHCIINSGAILEHDNVLGDYVHISPRVALGGTVSVASEVQVGIGAVVKNNTNIFEKCIVGAGAVVVDDIHECGIYIGVPARMMEDK